MKHITKFYFEQHKRPSLSLCMIARNEEKFLARCLQSVRGLVDEIVLVDTGSTDNTKNIASSFGCRIYDSPWEDDFALPRNISLSHASKEWILILDPDESLSLSDRFSLLRLMNQDNVLCFQLPTYNYSKNVHEIGFVKRNTGYYEQLDFPGYCPSVKTRLIKNGLGLKFRGCWHELLDYEIYERKIKSGYAELPVHHYTHEGRGPLSENKKEFYLRLGEKKVRQNPRDSQAWYELGVAESICGFAHRAERSVLNSLKLGLHDKKKMLLLSRLAMFNNNNKLFGLAWEKAICFMYPNLTHANIKSINAQLYNM